MAEFDPQRFLITARQLIDDKNYDEPSRYRTAIGRAYYAAHLISKKKLEEIGIKFPKIEDTRNLGIIHQMVIDYFKDRDDPIGDWLWDLRRARRNADYVLKFDFKRYGVVLLIDIAENVKNEVLKI